MHGMHVCKRQPRETGGRAADRAAVFCAHLSHLCCIHLSHLCCVHLSHLCLARKEGEWKLSVKRCRLSPFHPCPALLSSPSLPLVSPLSPPSLPPSPASPPSPPPHNHHLPLLLHPFLSYPSHAHAHIRHTLPPPRLLPQHRRLCRGDCRTCFLFC